MFFSVLNYHLTIPLNANATKLIFIEIQSSSTYNPQNFIMHAVKIHIMNL